MALLRKKQSNDVVRSGDLLVEQFHSALVTRVAMLTAKVTAKHTEEEALQSLASLPGNSPYTLPQDIPPEIRDQLGHASLDAHLQKVQSEQIGLQGDAFLAQTEVETLATYKGRKVRVTVLNPKEQPVDVYYRHPGTGELYLHKSQPRNFTGVIDDIQMRTNMLVLKPSFLKRVADKQIGYYGVYVINPETMGPLVRLTLLS